jgi:oligosaccharyltransferase complex subunit epsilon
MAPKQRTTALTGSPATTTTTTTPAATPARASKANNTDAAAIAQGIWDKYVSKTPQRTKLLDTFLAFLVIVGALQFLYVVLVGNFVRPQFLALTQSHSAEYLRPARLLH